MRRAARGGGRLEGFSPTEHSGATSADRAWRRGAPTTSLAIALGPSDDLARLRAVVTSVSDEERGAMKTPVSEEAIERLKFSVCLPKDLAVHMLETRLTDQAAIQAVLREPIRGVREDGPS